MKINWPVRLKNKAFWVALIPAVLLLVQVAAAVFGYKLDLGDFGNKLMAVVNAVFGLLAVLGVVNDPTTAGTSDSALALSYAAPRIDDEEPTYNRADVTAAGTGADTAETTPSAKDTAAQGNTAATADTSTADAKNEGAKG